MPKLPSLHAWTIVSLRPQGQHASVRSAVTRRKAQFCALSVTKLVAHPYNTEFKAALTSDIRIMSSPAAVHFAKQHGRLTGHWLAIGNQTAKCLFASGASSVLVPDLQTADGLLALDAVQHITGRTVGLFTAPNGRGLLEEALQERGALLHIAHVYQRQPVALNSRQLSKIDAFTAQTAIFVTSGNAFKALWQQLNPHRKAIIKSSLCVASSQRLVEYLQSQGMPRVLRSDTTLPHDQIHALAQAVLPDEPTGTKDD